jgi:predicted nucleic acid-binding protein
MNAVDTNILIYANDTRFPEKRLIARAIIDDLKDAVLLWQVACEYIAAARKLENLGFKESEAFDDLNFLSISWKTKFPTWEVMENSQRLKAKYSVSFWDSLIVGACLENNVEILYSEDIGNFFQSEGLKIINPFI